MILRCMRVPFSTAEQNEHKGHVLCKEQIQETFMHINEHTTVVKLANRECYNKGVR